MILAVILVLLGAVLRVLPHEANFTPIAAIALFGGVYLSKRFALLVPVAALVASDVIIGFDSLESRAIVYGSFLLIGLLGMIVKKRKNIFTIFGGVLGGSILFYLVTNFAYFYPHTMYPHTLDGAISSYYNALPFFRATLLGDMFYAGLLFGVYELAMFAGPHLSNRKKQPDSHAAV